MPDREQWLLRKIESLQSESQTIHEVIGNLTRELMTLRGMPVNDQYNYGGDIHPGERVSLNCAPIVDDGMPIY